MNDLTFLFPLFLIIAPVVAFYLKDTKIADLF